MLLCINIDNYKIKYSNYIHYYPVYHYFNFILLNTISRNAKYF